MFVLLNITITWYWESQLVAEWTFTRYWESQLVAEWTFTRYWGNQLVAEWTFTSGGVDVHTRLFIVHRCLNLSIHMLNFHSWSQP